MPFSVAWKNATIKNQVLSIAIYKPTKVASIFNKESVEWNLNK